MFSIQSCTVDPTELIYTCDWTYTNADGSVSGTHRLTPPIEGDEIVPLANVTEAILLDWLDDQLPNTAEEFDASIAKAKEAREKEEALTVLSFEEESVEEPEEEPAEEPAQEPVEESVEEPAEEPAE